MGESEAQIDLHHKRDEIIRIAARHGAGTSGCSGRSRAATTGRTAISTCWSKWSADRSLLDLVGLGQDLEDLLHRKVDVLTDASLHPALRERIVAEARAL